MKTEWDYTALADAYLKRPDYAPAAIDAMIRIAGLHAGGSVCDVGAGTAHLTRMLAQRGLRVTAVEPNDAMRRLGIERVREFHGVIWCDGTGEATGQPDDQFDAVTFGSSFNVTDRSRALRESIRILRRGGWFACLWNHRDLNDPVQSGIESIIAGNLTRYDYGVRREDQREVLEASRLLREVLYVEARVTHSQPVDDIIDAWRSHGTLQRQAGEAFALVVDEIGAYLRSLGAASISIPYFTRMWIAQAAK